MFFFCEFLGFSKKFIGLVKVSHESFGISLRQFTQDRDVTLRKIAGEVWGEEFQRFLPEALAREDDAHEDRKSPVPFCIGPSKSMQAVASLGQCTCQVAALESKLCVLVKLGWQNWRWLATPRDSQKEEAEQGANYG